MDASKLRYSGNPKHKHPWQPGQRGMTTKVPVSQFSSGRAEDFFVSVTLSTDPDGGLGATPEESASWGRLSLWASGRNLCAHSVGGDRSEDVTWYLLPWLEWLAGSWDALFHEQRLPNRPGFLTAARCLTDAAFPPPALDDVDAERWEETHYRWRSRHNVRSGRMGGVFPDLTIRRCQDDIELSWTDTPLAGACEGLTFTNSSGSVLLAPHLVATPLYEVLSWATGRLVELAGRTPRLRRLERAVERIATTDPEVRLAWLAGLGAAVPALRAAWRRVARLVEEASDGKKAVVDRLFASQGDAIVVSGSCSASLLFGSLAPDVRSEDVVVLAREMVASTRPRRGAAAAGPLDAFVRAAPFEGGVGSTSWQEGYDLAIEFLEARGGAAALSEFVDIEAVLADLAVRVRDVELSDRDVRAVALAGDRHLATICVNRRYEPNATPAGRRFTLAHELCHLLHDRSHARSLALASGPWAPLHIEQRANAFAAMLLMPTDLVKSHMAAMGIESFLVPDRVHSLAGRLHTSVSATVEHLVNLGLAQKTLRDRIRYAN